MIKVIGKYSEDKNTFFVTCPVCGITHTHELCSFTAKQWLGSYLCSGGINPETDKVIECDTELFIERIEMDQERNSEDIWTYLSSLTDELHKCRKDITQLKEKVKELKAKA